MKEPFAGRVAKLGEEERRSYEVLIRAVRHRGPLWTARGVASGDLGGPVVRAVYGRVPGAILLRGRVGFTLFAFLGPVALGWLALVATNELLGPDSPGWQPVALVAALGVMALLAVTFLYLLALRPTRGRILRSVTGWSTQDLVWWGLLLLVTPTAAFAAATALLVFWEDIGVRGVTAETPSLAYHTGETFLWNLADAVPVLKIPETMAWKPQLRFTTDLGRGLVLAYKILLILPFAQLAAIGLARSFGDDPDGMEGGSEPAESTHGETTAGSTAQKPA